MGEKMEKRGGTRKKVMKIYLRISEKFKRMMRERNREE